MHVNTICLVLILLLSHLRLITLHLNVLVLLLLVGLGHLLLLYLEHLLRWVDLVAHQLHMHAIRVLMVERLRAIERRTLIHSHCILLLVGNRRANYSHLRIVMQVYAHFSSMETTH